MWLDRSLVHITENSYIFQNENRDNCRHVALELETVVFVKKRHGGEVIIIVDYQCDSAARNREPAFYYSKSKHSNTLFPRRLTQESSRV
jgi:hypothetical protein